MPGMNRKRLTLDVRDDGSARLSLSYAPEGRHGLARLSCDLAPADLVALSLFSEAIDFRARQGADMPASLEVAGLRISRNAGSTTAQLSRSLAMKEQHASVDWADLQARMADIVDLCLARAEESRHGPALKAMIAEADLAGGPDGETLLIMDEVQAHRLREMAFLILAETTSDKRAPLARMLRGKKGQAAAADHVHQTLRTLALELLAPPAPDQGEGDAEGALVSMMNPGSNSAPSCG